MTEKDFVEAIARDPGDESAYLVYADWLIERGDPKGEYIALSCAMEHAPWWTPEGRTLRRKCRQLLEAHGAGWSPKVGDGQAAWRFRRGLPVGVTVDHRMRDIATQLWDAAPLLTSLRLRSGSLTREALQQLLELTTVRTRVTSLAFTGTGVLAAGTAQVLADHAPDKLAALDFTDIRLLPAEIRILAQAPRIAALKELVLDGVPLGNQGVGALRVGYGFGELTRLGVARAQVGAALLPLLLERRRPLTQLDLSANGIAVEGAAFIAAQSEADGRLARLERLGLGGTSHTTACFVQLARSRFEHLLELDLSGGRSGNEGAEELALSEGFPALRVLRFSDAMIERTGALALASAPFAKSLAILDLRGNRLGRVEKRLKKLLGDRVLVGARAPDVESGQGEP